MIACPNCKSDKSFVVDSRPNEHGVRRRRECRVCNERYSTVEFVMKYERGGDRRNSNIDESAQRGVMPQAAL